MEKIVIFSDEFQASIEQLIQILFDKDYFGFKIDCHHYADKIYDFVENSINFPISKNSPVKFQKHGKKYLKYAANKRTTWYIFFDQKGNQFLVNHILNNHFQEFPELL